MAKMKFPVVIEQDEDGMYIGTVPDIKGCHSYGETLDELMENIKEAIIANIEVLKAESKKLPKVYFSGVQQVEVEV
jgi:predicted RNase H-like HicB family nuclease